MKVTKTTTEPEMPKGLLYSQLKVGKVYRVETSSYDSDFILKTTKGHVYFASGHAYSGYSYMMDEISPRFFEYEAEVKIGNSLP